MTALSQMADLEQGQKAVVRKLCVLQGMRRRLQDMGLVEGTRIECLGKSPLGDPTAFLIRGAVIALRREDAGKIEVALEEPCACGGGALCQTEGGREAIAVDGMGRDIRVWG